MFPTKTPPLRADRDTILIGKGSAADDFAVQIDGESAGKPVTLNWNVKATKPSDDNAFLAQLNALAETDGGLGLPTLGSEGLWEARRVLNSQAHSLAKLGQQAAATGDVQKAKQFVNAAVDRDPNDSNALVLKRSLDQAPPPTGSAPAPTADRVPPEPLPGDLLNSVEQRQQVIQQQVMTESTVEMNHARDKMTADPSGVIDDLKRLMDRVLRVAELTSDQRYDLRSRISTMLQQATQRLAAKEAADAERQQNLAAARDRQRTLNLMERKETQLDGLIDRFNALVDMGYQNDDLVTNDYLRQARRDAADEFHRAAKESLRSGAGGGDHCAGVRQLCCLPNGRYGGKTSCRALLYGYAAFSGYFAHSVPRFAADCLSRRSVLAENQQGAQGEVFIGRLVDHEPD